MAKRWWNLLLFCYFFSSYIIFQCSCLFSNPELIQHQVRKIDSITRNRHKFDSIPAKRHHHWLVKHFESQIWSPQRNCQRSFTQRGCYTLSGHDLPKIREDLENWDLLAGLSWNFSGGQRRGWWWPKSPWRTRPDSFLNVDIISLMQSLLSSFRSKLLWTAFVDCKQYDIRTLATLHHSRNV